MNTSEDAKDARCSMGVAGLDAILEGGLPRNRLYLLKGDPGVGKTTLALQFLMEGVRLGEAGLYVTLSETKEEIEAVGRSHGWDLSQIHLYELTAVEQRIRDGSESTFFHPSEVELDRTTEALLAEVDRINPRRVVFDSLSEFRMLADTAIRYRRHILHFKQHLAGRNCTVLLLDDKTAGSDDLQVESIAHGVICLDRSLPDYGEPRRQISVQKIRGSSFRGGNHDLLLQKGGMVVFPRLIAAKHHRSFMRENFSTGVPDLDALLGGGLGRGTSTMFMGPPGTGKSTLIVKLALTAAERGEKSRVYIFDETVGTMMDRASKLGMDLGPHVESGTLVVEQIDPAEISPGEMAHRIHHSVAECDTRMIVIDSINGYLNAMPHERHLALQLHELLAYLNQQGVVTLMVLAQQGLIGPMQSAVDLTYLADTVVLTRYFEERGEIKQAISVIKKRSGNHERTLRSFSVGPNGITLGPPLREMHGVLTGVPTVLSEGSNHCTPSK